MYTTDRDVCDDENLINGHVYIYDSGSYRLQNRSHKFNTAMISSY